MSVAVPPGYQIIQIHGQRVAVDPNDPETADLLRHWDEILDENPLEAYYPHGKQKPFHEAKVRVKVFLGGNRSGKSTAGVVDDLIQALDRDVIPKHLQQFKVWEPPFYCRVVTPDFGRTLKAVSEAIRHWCPKSQFKGGSWDSAYSKQDKVFELANGSFMEFMTYEQDIDKFGGSARHRIHFDEEPDGEKGEEVREECSMRLIDYKGDELFTFTPLNGLGWTFDEFEEEKGPEVQKDVWLNESMVVIRADMEDNPTLDKDEIEYRLSKLPEKQRSARKSGNFEHFKGLVYEMFNPELHIVPKATKEHVADLRINVAIDPGMQVTAVQFGGFDKENCLLVFDELHLSGDAVGDSNPAIPKNAAESIFTKLKWWGVDPSKVRFWIDPSARNRSLSDAMKVQELYKHAGIRARQAQNDVEAGVFELQRRLENKDAEGNPDPLYLLAENCLNTRKEFPKYRLDIQDDGKFKVVKKNDHHMDGDRYLAMSHPLPEKPRPKPKHRKEAYVPGTAPPTDFRRRREPVGPLGAYS